MKVGEYKKGSDPVADEAVDKLDAINGVLKQGLLEQSAFAETIERMSRIADG